MVKKKNTFYINVEIFLNNILWGKKVIVCSKGLRKAPLNTLKLFFRKMFLILFFNIHKNAFDTNSRYVSQKYARNKKERNFWSSNWSVLAKCFPMLVETLNFRGVIYPKNLLKYELGSKLFFLSGLAYKLVNLIIFGEKIM